MASKRRNMFQKNKTQETTGNDNPSLSGISEGKCRRGAWASGVDQIADPEVDGSTCPSSTHTRVLLVCGGRDVIVWAPLEVAIRRNRFGTTKSDQETTGCGKYSFCYPPSLEEGTVSSFGLQPLEELKDCRHSAWCDVPINAGGSGKSRTGPLLFAESKDQAGRMENGCKDEVHAHQGICIGCNTSAFISSSSFLQAGQKDGAEDRHQIPIVLVILMVHYAAEVFPSPAACPILLSRMKASRES
ncbi:hypothetical protein AAG570_001879 [Ranatra chinensis]|uniref:Uncharacterized protein n=1 Tax=Ranatra chinensis TaxID=642074 RepID=A0ABD0YY26_9HEMI